MCRVKTVLSKIDATGSVESCSGRDPLRTTRSPDTISDMATEQSDLNHVDYGVWGYKSVSTSATGSQTWKSCQRVEDEWDRLDQEVIDNAISEWRTRLTACIAAGGGHLEHSL